MGESGPGDHDDGRQRQLAARGAGLVGGRWHSGRTAPRPGAQGCSLRGVRAAMHSNEWCWAVDAWHKSPSGGPSGCVRARVAQQGQFESVAGALLHSVRACLQVGKWRMGARRVRRTPWC